MPDVESLLREVLAGQAVQGAQLKNLENKVDKAAIAADNARDLSNKINTILEEQDIGTRFSEHRGEVRQQMSEMRQDVVAAITKVRTDIEANDRKWAKCFDELEKRIEALESDFHKREGVRSLVGWLMKNAPWLFTGIAAFAAGVGFKDRVP
jgi:hypothetical protein